MRPRHNAVSLCLSSVLTFGAVWVSAFSWFNSAMKSISVKRPLEAQSIDRFGLRSYAIRPAHSDNSQQNKRKVASRGDWHLVPS